MSRELPTIIESRETREALEAFTLLSDDDLRRFAEGTHSRLHDVLGAHPRSIAGMLGTYFAVWAPNAERVTVVGDWNGWHEGDPLRPHGSSGSAAPSSRSPLPCRSTRSTSAAGGATKAACSATESSPLRSSSTCATSASPTWS